MTYKQLARKVFEGNLRVYSKEADWAWTALMEMKRGRTEPCFFATQEHNAFYILLVGAYLGEV